MNEARYGHRVGDDGGCFSSALADVRRWGGVLEHPAFTYAWPAFGLMSPQRGCWTSAGDWKGWVTEVSQVAYGHPARKRTWLYAVGCDLPRIDWSEPAPTAQVSFCANHGDSPLPRLSKAAASASPVAFRDLLLNIARSVKQKERAA